VDVWDGDSLLLIGTFSVPLWRLMRQGQPVAKLAHEVRMMMMMRRRRRRRRRRSMMALRMRR
jgi:hypothetical protein